MDKAVTVFTYAAPITEVPRVQILRYLGMSGTDGDENVNALIDKLYPVMMDAMKFKACYLEVPVSITDNIVSLEYLSVKSGNLSSILRGCDRAVITAATAGIEADIAVKRAEVTSKAEALILNAISVAGIEKFMADFNLFLKDKYDGYALRPRFSPGYGDVPLLMQKELLNVLDAGRKIGVTLTDSLLMTPKKSVSAIIGIAEDGCINIDKDCDICSKRDCEFRL